MDPLGGASVAYYDAIAERYHLNLEVVNHRVDPTFRFMTVDWDGQIRMDPSSVYAMASLIGLKDRFAVAFASDTDADRHGIVSHSQGLLPPTITWPWPSPTYSPTGRSGRKRWPWARPW